MKNFLKTLWVLVFMVGMVHQAFAWDFSDLRQTGTSSNSYDFSDLGPRAKQSKSIMHSDSSQMNSQSASWDFSDLGKDKNDISRFEICNISEDTIDYTVSGNRDVLKNNYCRSWATPGPGVVQFGQSVGGGLQTQSYTVKEGSYYFKKISTGSPDASSFIDLRAE
jgi:hypothetical protein